MRRETEGAHRGDEGRDCGSTAAKGSGRRKRSAAGGEERQAGEEGEVKRNTDKGTESSVPLSVDSIDSELQDEGHQIIQICKLLLPMQYFIFRFLLIVLPILLPVLAAFF